MADSPKTVLLRYRSAGKTAGTSRPMFGLPQDLLEKARRRLLQLTLVLFVMFGLMFVLNVVEVLSGVVPPQMRNIAILASGSLLVTNAVVWMLARSERVSIRAALACGLGYELYLCGGATFAGTWVSTSLYGHAPLVTWGVAFMLAFPLIVPRPMKATIWMALAEGATMPLAAVIVPIAEGIQVVRANYFTATTTAIIAVALAVACSRVVYLLNRDVADARKVGRYSLERRLGAGGMGEVWLARHDMLVRPAAIKLVRPAAIGRDGQNAEVLFRRFDREAQVTANLTSAHTVGVYDFGRTEGGTFYYVMELLDGIDLETLVERYGPQPPDRVLHMLHQACLSLAEAHDVGLVHRDIKPANIMLVCYGREPDFVKILDFGLVTWEAGDGPPNEDSVRLSREGTIGGTPAFMPPEMARGEKVDGRADLYSLGCVAFFLLTGRTVFDGEKPIDMIVAHIKDAPPSPSELAEQDLPGDLERLVLDCLAKDPTNRPGSADELMARIESCALYGAWTSRRAAQWWEMYRPETVSQSATGE